MMEQQIRMAPQSYNQLAAMRKPRDKKAKQTQTALQNCTKLATMMMMMLQGTKQQRRTMAKLLRMQNKKAPRCSCKLDLPCSGQEWPMRMRKPALRGRLACSFRGRMQTRTLEPCSILDRQVRKRVFRMVSLRSMLGIPVLRSLWDRLYRSMLDRRVAQRSSSQRKSSSIVPHRSSKTKLVAH